MVLVKKLSSGGHVEVDLPVPTAIEEILNHLTKGGIAVTEEGKQIKIENVREIKESDKVLLIPAISGGKWR